MSIKDFFDAVGEAFSILFGAIKSVFYQLYTSEWGMTVIFWVVVVVYVFIKFTDWLQRRQIAKEQKKLDVDEAKKLHEEFEEEDKEKTLKDNPEMFDEEGNISPDFDFVEEAIKLMPDDKEKQGKDDE